MTGFDQKKIFSNNLNHLLDERQRTQREVANSIGVSAQTFNTWCRGIAIPRMDKIQKLADFFHVEKSSLIDPPSPDRTSSMDLTASELSLLQSFRLLDDVDQAKASSYIDGLLSNDKYIKTVVENSVG